MNTFRIALLLSLGALMVACTDDDDSSWDPSELYTGDIENIVVEVDYQAGAEPYTDGGAFAGEPWDLFELNMKALFNHVPTTLKIPHTLGEMQKLDDIEDTKFTLEEIAEIAKEHQDTPNKSGQRVIYIVFLNGVSEDEQGNQEEVLGLSIRGTNIVAVFKPIIKTRSTTYPELAEQINIIHEVGHAVGLVDAGVPMVDDHLDESANAGVAHCANKDCVMYYEFEMDKNVDARLHDILERESQILFGNECLKDTDNAAGAL